MLIGISQSVQFLVERGEKRDFLDQAWHDFFYSIEMEILPIPTRIVNADRWLDNRGIDAILLSGGNNINIKASLPDVAPERDSLEASLVEWAINNQKPVVGVCRGLQFLNSFFGGSLNTIENHAGNRHSLLINPFYKDFADYSSVNSFHNFGISFEELSSQFNCIAYTEDGYVEAAHHSKLPILGIMWHPERDNAPNQSLDRNIIMNHLKKN